MTNKKATREQVIKDMQRVHKVFPDAQPDRDFYREHGRFKDSDWKRYFPKFKDFAKAAIAVKPFEEARRALNRALMLIRKREGNFNKQEMDALSDRATELDEEFYMWRLIKEMDEEEAREKQASAEEVPTVVIPDPPFLKEKQ
jgi:hypothetical protein